MPLNKDIHKVLVIGSGPIVIGQAAEFDYAGAQACRALKEDGIEIVLVNSNPATIMTDSHMADEIYLEPLTAATVERIIEKEHPDAILSGLGGQTGLNLSMELAESGFLDSHNVRLLGSFPETIRKAEDREAFKETMDAIGQPTVPSEVVTDVDAAVAFAERTGYPVIVRPAFTLGGAGGGIAEDEEALRRIGAGGIRTSPIGQILVETSVAGWKEIEFEVVRDGAGNAVTVCAMENFDPVGVHTGDSIVAAPTLTLADKEYQMLRTAALDIVGALGVEGGCNCQFALDPESFRYAVIEVNPRVSRSSALASKATGYPIARVAAKIALGYRLDEIPNEITGSTYAAFEPALDYVAIKFPKWPFDKFAGCDRTLGTQMKATGEVMAIADGFVPALMKAVRGAEIGLDSLRAPFASGLDDDALMESCAQITDRRLFFLFEALRRGRSVEALHELTKIDEWFLWQLADLAAYETAVENRPMSEDNYWQGKRYGYPDSALRRLSGSELPLTAQPTYKMVDTSAGEFAARTPYFYATFNAPSAGGEDEAAAEIAKGDKETVVVLGSGPIRIGQGIEFDYACVHAVLALRAQGFNVVMINNNPETVSTDFDTADRLYFEPLTFEDVMPVLAIEKPRGVVVAFGGQTAIRLTGELSAAGVPILGTSASGIDMAEDRERFDALLTREHIDRAEGRTVMTTDEALAAARELTYPVLLRPSYVLGGQNMVIARDDETIRDYMTRILAQRIDNPVLVDKYIEGREIEVDAVFDGTDVLIPAIMEHVERTGIHSGDSIAICPALHIDDELAERLTDITLRLCRGLDAVGIVNVQYILTGGRFYVIEVNPRASRTVPFLSKVTGIPLVDLAVRAALGEKLADMGYGTGLHAVPLDVAVKVPVFSFEKMGAIDILLGPEMKSTGEVLGFGRNYREAIYKGLNAAGYRLPRTGGVFITVRDQDKHQVAEIARKFHDAGFRLYATHGTAEVLEASDLPVAHVAKLHQPHGEDEPDAISLLESGQVQVILSTSSYGIDPARDSARIRRRAIALGIPCLTAPDTANALADSLLGRYNEHSTELVDNNHHRTQRRRVPFVKMQSCGNDFVFLDGFEGPVNAPETLAVALCDRRRGVGADGIVTLEPDETADAVMHMYNSDGATYLYCNDGDYTKAYTRSFGNPKAQTNPATGAPYPYGSDRKGGIWEYQSREYNTPNNTKQFSDGTNFIFSQASSATGTIAKLDEYLQYYKQQDADADKNWPQYEYEYNLSSAYLGIGRKVTPIDFNAPANIDVAWWRTDDTFQEMVNSGYQPYVFFKNAADFDGSLFLKYLVRNSSGGQLSTDFATLTKKVNNLIDKGSVVQDQIGNDFDFINDPSRIAVKVGDETLQPVATAENTYGFGENSDGTYRYELVYNADSNTGAESLDLKVNETVFPEKPVQLIYSEKLVNIPTASGSYEFNVNESAVLMPMDSEGETLDPITFPVPKVTLRVVNNAPVSITKTFNGLEPDENLLGSIRVIIAQNNDPMRELTLADFTEDNGVYTYTMEGEEGSTYSVTESGAEVNGYRLKTTLPEAAQLGDNGLTLPIINTYKKTGGGGGGGGGGSTYLSKTVTKVWEDDNNAAGKRPESVTIQLYRDNEAYGDPVTITEEDNWKHTWSRLPASGKYTVGETDIGAGYTSSVDQSSLTITNTYKKPELNKTDHDAYIVGYPDGTVQPQGNITRAEAAVIYFRLLTADSRKAYWDTECSFSDVNQGDWYNNAIATLQNAGILAGDGSAFRPNDPITRAELAAIATRFDKFSGKTGGSAAFNDTKGHWAEAAIAHAAEIGWVKGYPDGSFKPDAHITRAETMTLINRVLERAVEAEGMHPDMIVWPDNPADAWYYAEVQEATNSHTYIRTEKKVDGYSFNYEKWTAIKAVPSWDVE